MKINKQLVIRWSLYIVGIFTLALGLCLSKKAGLGVAANVAIAFVAAEIWNLNIANANFVLFVSFVAIEFLMRGKRARAYDLLQIPLALVFSQLMAWFDKVVSYRSGIHGLGSNLLVLTMAMLCIAIGASLIVNMRLIPHPVDGVVVAIMEKLKCDHGFAKNIFDVVCVLLSVVLSYAAAGKLVGVGIGTIIAMVCVGRMIHFVNKLFKKSMCTASGLSV